MEITQPTSSFEGLRKSGPRLTPSTLRLEISDAAGLLANSGFERFLGRGHFSARLGEIVGKAHNLAFGRLCNRIVGALANGVVWRNLQVGRWRRARPHQLSRNYGASPRRRLVS